MSDATTGFGTVLAGVTVGTVGNILTISGPNETRDAIDLSTADSAAQVREFMAGMIDSGEITLTVNYDGSDSGVANALHTAFLAGTAEVWTITFKDTSTAAASGFITALGQTAPFDDKVTQDITIKLTAVVTYTDVV